MKRSTDVPRLPREKVLQAKDISDAAARFLVSNYYHAQELRKRADMQLRHLGDGAGNQLAYHLEWYGEANSMLETQTLRQLKAYAENKKIGQWMLEQQGVGPVIAAGCLAYLDVKGRPTAGSFLRFCDIDPTLKWEKGKKRPYCAAMKQIMFHFGECAKRVSGNPEAFYGRLYKERKALVTAKNEAGGYAERALNHYTTNSAEVKRTLKQGKLPAGNLDRQACNFAAKIFLSHLHALMYWEEYGTPTPRPYPISILGHGHEIKIPNMDLFPGFEEAYYGQQIKQVAAE